MYLKEEIVWLLYEKFQNRGEWYVLKWMKNFWIYVKEIENGKGFSWMVYKLSNITAEIMAKSGFDILSIDIWNMDQEI